MGNVYEKHDCGGDIIDDEPSYIPIGEDAIIKVIDQRCNKCDAVIIGKYQKIKIIHNKATHDKLIGLL